MSLADLFETGNDKIEKSHIRNLIKIARADGHIDEPEMEVLYEIAQRYDFGRDEVNEMIETIDQYQFTPPTTKKQRYIQFRNLVKMVWADNVVDDREVGLCKRFAIGLGFPIAKVPGLVDIVINSVRDGDGSQDTVDKIDDFILG